MHDAAVWPASSSPEDLAATARAEAWHNFPLFLGPLVYGLYPEGIEGHLAPYLPQDHDDDMDDLCVPPDFVGLNYYFGYVPGCAGPKAGQRREAARARAKRS